MDKEGKENLRKLSGFATLGVGVGGLIDGKSQAEMRARIRGALGWRVKIKFDVSECVSM